MLSCTGRAFAQHLLKGVGVSLKALQLLETSRHDAFPYILHAFIRMDCRWRLLFLGGNGGGRHGGICGAVR